MTDQLQQNRYDRLIRRVGGIIGPGSKVSEALSELFPVIDVERVPGELMLLMGTRLGVGGTEVAASVGESGRAQLFNPIASGHIVTLTSVFMSCVTSGTFRWGTRSAAIGADIDGGVARDTRVTGLNNTVAEVRTDQSVALANANGTTKILPRTPFYLHDPDGLAVLAPGTGFECGLDIQNEVFLFTFYWREREFVSSEDISF